MLITPRAASVLLAGFFCFFSFSPLTNANTAFCANVTDISHSECEALAELYQATSGDNWTNNNNWLVGTSACDWEGISCDISSSYVTRISLSLHNLSGSIPASLSNLIALDRLELNQNALSGFIPAELGSITTLRNLNLADNNLSGEFPLNLFNLINLTSIDLSNNQLSGIIPPQVENWINLTILNLRSNQLTGSIPVELGNLTDLEYLYIQENQFNGPIPSQLGNLVNLKVLSAYSNQFSGELPAGLSNLASIIYLSFGKNQLSGEIPEELGNLNVERLGLDGNNFTGSIPSALGNISQLTSLLLSSNKLEGSIPAELANPPNLVTLFLHSNQLSGDVPNNILDIRDRDRGRLLIDFNKLNSTGLLIDDSSQTVTPEHFSISRDSDHTLRWVPISYAYDGGAYIISYSDSPDGPFTEHGRTSDITIDEYIVSDAANYPDRYYVIQSYTPSHFGFGLPQFYQPNNLTSDYSDAIAFDFPPIVTPPENITVLSSGDLTVVDIGAATAIDFFDGAVAATADNVGPFAVGEHTITWSATDSAGNVGTATQTVTVNETTVDTGWIRCAGEGRVCQVPATAEVRYGANDQYSTQIITDEVLCANAVFGDPIWGVYKYCEYRLSGSSDFDGDGVADSIDAFPEDATESEDTDGDGFGDNSDPFVNDATNNASAGWQFCAIEWFSCDVPADAWVRYGADGKYSYHRVNESIRCNNASFGDPIWGRLKQCSYLVISN